MLLSLLKPDVRMEYARAGTAFPVRNEINNFIGAGINLAHSNAIDFGYRAISSDATETALFFADFVNYTILLDLFKSISTLSEPLGADIVDLRVNLSEDRVRDFVASATVADTFMGTLEGCNSLQEIECRIRDRLNAYRRYLHVNDKELNSQIRESKTNIGEPLSEIVGFLKDTAVIGQDVAIFLHIDQYEELANISSTEENSPDYRRIINRALARRDPAISYRIGTRGHAWRNHGFIFGVDAKLEEERDYKYVDLDVLLRRNENRKTWVFPEFVQDVFARRLKHAGLTSEKLTGLELLEHVFGKGMRPEDKAKKYGGTNRRRIIKTDVGWPEDFKTELVALAEEDPLTARLLEAWVLQQLERVGKKKNNTPSVFSLKWICSRQCRKKFGGKKNELSWRLFR